MKRQRWMANKGGCGGGGQPRQQHQPQAQEQRRPPALGDMSGLVAAAPPGPKSPLSRFVAEGYSQAPQPSTMQQPYGEKPNSRGSGGSYPSGGGGGGFDANVAGQWNSNVKNQVMNSQNRHDPAVSGPGKAVSGVRTTQASGGNASIDLSWGGQQPGGPQPGGGAPSMPPRMPGSGGSGGSGGAQYGAPLAPQALQGMNYGAQAYDQRTPAYADPRYARNPSPSPAERRTPSCPWGQDDNPAGGGRAMPRREAAPFGVDAMPQQGMMRSGSRGPRGASPSPQQQPCFGGGEGMAAGGPRGRAAGGIRPPGGQSSVVFG